MKNLYLLIFVLITSFGIAQTPDVIYYPNSINTPTYLPFGCTEYLCGPNTVVNDTLMHGCKIYVSNNCTLTLKPNCSACAGTTGVFLQGNSVLNILSGNCTNYYLVSEPAATINNPMNVPISSNTVTTISWPTVNCNANGIKSNNLENENLILYPNPANEILNIELVTLSGVEASNTTYSILNSLGQVIKEEILQSTQQPNGSVSATINTKELANGVYSIQLSSRGTRDLNTDPSLRNDNIPSVTKRFVIAR
jgi:hypothetical protein